MCSKQNEDEGRGEAMFGELVGRVSGVGRELGRKRHCY